MKTLMFSWLRTHARRKFSGKTGINFSAISKRTSGFKINEGHRHSAGSGARVRGFFSNSSTCSTWPRPTVWLCIWSPSCPGCPVEDEFLVMEQDFAARVLQGRHQRQGTQRRRIGHAGPLLFSRICKAGIRVCRASCRRFSRTCRPRVSYWPATCTRETATAT